MKVTPDNILSDWVADEQFWEKKIPFFNSKEVERMLGIGLSKMGSLLKRLHYQ